MANCPVTQVLQQVPFGEELMEDESLESLVPELDAKVKVKSEDSPEYGSNFDQCTPKLC